MLIFQNVSEEVKRVWFDLSKATALRLLLDMSKEPGMKFNEQLFEQNGYYFNSEHTIHGLSYNDTPITLITSSDFRTVYAKFPVTKSIRIYESKQWTRHQYRRVPWMHEGNSDTRTGYNLNSAELYNDIIKSHKRWLSKKKNYEKSLVNKGDMLKKRQEQLDKKHNQIPLELAPPGLV